MFRCGKRSPCLIVGAGKGSHASLMSALGAENAVPVGWARALGKPRPCGGEIEARRR